MGPTHPTRNDAGEIIACDDDGSGGGSKADYEGLWDEDFGFDSDYH